MGRHGVIDKSVNYLSTRRQGSADRIPVFLFLLFVNVLRANLSEAMQVSNGTAISREERQERRIEEEERAGVPGMVTRKEKEGSKTAR